MRSIEQAFAVTGRGLRAMAPRVVQDFYALLRVLKTLEGSTGISAKIIFSYLNVSFM